MKRELKQFFGMLALSLLGTPGTLLAMPLTTMPTTLYVLGDSLSDVGNLFLATGGATDPTNAAPPTPDYFQGRFSNGPIYAEYLWTSLGLPGALMPSLAGGTNYAFGGARSRYHRSDLEDPAFNPVGGASSFLEFSLLGQREALLSDTGGVLDPGALYTVWSGSNDVADAIALAARGNPLAGDLIAQSVGDRLAVIQDLINAGAQNFLIPNTPNFGVVPEILQLNSVDAQRLATELSMAFNDLVDAGLADIGANANVNIIGFDTFQFLTDLVGDPTQFGFPSGVNTIDPCFTGFVGIPGEVCNDPGNRIFWDFNHPSAVAHQVLGAAVTRAVVPEPSAITLIALVLALLALQLRQQGGVARRFPR